MTCASSRQSCRWWQAGDRAGGRDLTAYRPAIEHVVAAVRGSGGVTGDGHVAVAVVGLGGDAASRAKTAEQLQNAVTKAAGWQIPSASFSRSPNVNISDVAVTTSGTHATTTAPRATTSTTSLPHHGAVLLDADLVIHHRREAGQPCSDRGRPRCRPGTTRSRPRAYASSGPVELVVACRPHQLATDQPAGAASIAPDDVSLDEYR